MKSSDPQVKTKVPLIFEIAHKRDAKIYETMVSSTVFDPRTKIQLPKGKLISLKRYSKSVGFKKIYNKFRKIHKTETKNRKMIFKAYLIKKPPFTVLPMCAKRLIYSFCYGKETK